MPREIGIAITSAIAEASTVPNTSGREYSISEKSAEPENSWLARIAGRDSRVRKMATAARVTKMRSPEPTLRALKSASPKRRPPDFMEAGGADAASGSMSAVLMGTFLRAHGSRAGRWPG